MIKRKLKFVVQLIILQLCIFTSNSQIVFQHIDNKDIYSFLDELANQHIIELNGAIKPYSRIFISDKLTEALAKSEDLSKSRVNEIEFYLRDYNKERYLKGDFKKRYDIFFYKDSLFTFSLNPILGIEYFTNENGTNYHRWQGGEFFAYVGPHVGIYASLRDNKESKVLSDEGFLTPRTGALYKPDQKGGGEYSETRGGIIYSWKWGHFGLLKDQFSWGNNYHGSNIFSGRTPSFAHIKFSMKPVEWFEFNYIHGFLVSNVLDTGRSYVAGVKEREVFFPKYIAANMYTFKPFKKLYVSVGNSIVYSDEFQLAYLFPFYFYKSADHSQSSTGSNFLGQNSQVYFDISSRQLKYLHLYTSIFIDEISFSRFNSPDEHSNFISLKAGVSITHPIVPNTTFIFEYTRTNPIVYEHFVSTTTFATNNFILGNYLNDNAEELYFKLQYRPIGRLILSASYTMARRGEDYEYTGTDGSGLGLPFIEENKWKYNDFSFRASFQLINDGYLFATFTSGDQSGEKDWTAPYFRGKTNTLSAGLNIGF
jgi:Capsule assembly protein Wzi